MVGIRPTGCINCNRNDKGRAVKMAKKKKGKKKYGK